MVISFINIEDDELEVIETQIVSITPNGSGSVQVVIDGDETFFTDKVNFHDKKDLAKIYF